MARGAYLPARLWKDARGASAVEFALILPIYLLLVLGGLAYGIYFGAAHSVQQLAADAARAAVAGLTPEERGELVDRFIENNAASYVLIDPDRLDAFGETSPFDSTQYLVTVTYDASALPIWNIYPPIPMPARTITYRSTIRNGGI